MRKFDFDSSLNSLLADCGSIEVRIKELFEYEKQWRFVFDQLIPKYGSDVRVKIANQLLLTTYRYDKFHIVADDLLSLLESLLF